jgi:hypothetical protein
VTHLRQLVRDATVTRLVAAEVLPAASIHKEMSGNITTKPFSSSADTLPAICVYIGGDKARRPTDTAPWETTITLHVDVFVTDEDDEAAANAREDLCEAVEAALFDVATWLQDYELVGELETSLRQGTNERLISTARITLQLVTSNERHIVAEDLDAAELVHVDVTIADTDPPAPDVVVEAEPAQ